MSILIIDFGNTRLKWRLLEGKRQLAHGAVAHARRDPNPDAGLTRALMHQWLDLAPPVRILYASVAGEAANAELEHALSQLFATVAIERVRAAAQLGGIDNGYAEPEQLGVDRLLAMVGARGHVRHGSLLVVGVGTATTVDLIDATHRFIGGVILPGPELMAQALRTGTAGLPRIHLAAGISDDFADRTGSAIGAGIINAQAGAIERLRQRALARDGALVCLLGGGGGAALMPYLSFPAQLADNLVLDGLARLAGS